MLRHFCAVLICTSIFAGKRKHSRLASYEHNGIKIFFNENRKQQKSAVGFSNKTDQYYKVTLIVGITGLVSVTAQEDASKAPLFSDLEKQYKAYEATFDPERTSL